MWTPCLRGSRATAGTPGAGTATLPSTGACPGGTLTPWTGGGDYQHGTFKQDFLLQGGDEVRGEVVQRDDYPAGDQEAAVGGGDLDPEQQKHEDQRGRADHGGEGRRLLLRSVAQSAALQAPCK